MSLYRFGAFEFDDRSGELRRAGARVRLRPQPAAILAHLLQRPFQIVSRIELRRVLWPNDVFVQFDHGLNSCIKQIRAALWDTRIKPAYLETLSRRGYRLIAPVEVIADGEAPSAARPRLYVLPFQPFSAGDACRAFAGGLTAEVTSRMSSHDPCPASVVSPPPGWWHGHRAAAIPAGIEYALTGSVRMSGRRFRVTVQLLDTQDYTHLWGAVFSGDLDEIFDAEPQIALSVTADVARELRLASARHPGFRALRA